jgi:putative membrane protein
LKLATYIGGLLGLGLLITLVIRADFASMAETLVLAGWPLLWLIPYRALFFLMFAIGWFRLLAPYNAERNLRFDYIYWVTTVREAIDRLLPVASVGGGLAAVRLLRWRGIGGAPAGATVIVEILLNLIASYLFAVLGLLLLMDIGAQGHEFRGLIYALIATLPVPIVVTLLLRHGSVFDRLQRFLRPMVGATALSNGAAALDREVRATLDRRATLVLAGGLQLVALISGAFEVWLALRLFGHPVGIKAAITLESMTQAVRQVAFVVPAGVGVQEAGLILFGAPLGISRELALAVSMAKRLREVLWGVASLASWQWLEGRRLRFAARNP